VDENWSYKKIDLIKNILKISANELKIDTLLELEHRTLARWEDPWTKYFLQEFMKKIPKGFRLESDYLSKNNIDKDGQIAAVSDVSHALGYSAAIRDVALLMGYNLCEFLKIFYNLSKKKRWWWGPKYGFEAYDLVKACLKIVGKKNLNKYVQMYEYVNKPCTSEGSDGNKL